MKVKFTALMLSLLSVFSIFKSNNSSQRNMDLASNWLANHQVEQTGELDFVVCENGK